MKLLPSLAALCLLPLLAALPCRAQGAVSLWQGEWGAFGRVASKGPSPRYAGAGLSITKCSEGVCQFSVTVQELNGANGDGSGSLAIQSSDTALATMHATGSYRCALQLTRKNTEPPMLTMAPAASAAGAGCTAFLTPGASFVHNFPLRSAVPFYGDNLPPCFAERGPARQALCTHAGLASLENRWRLLSYSTADLHSRDTDVAAAQAAIVKGCDGGSDPTACLQAAFDGSMAAMNAADKQWLQTVTAPGDPDQAAEKIVAIAGAYRHTFQSGDVQGDSFEVTDTLQIGRASAVSIRYTLHLNFFNGHECSREGTASYREAGLFADRQQLDPAVFHNAGSLGGLCVFELIPTEEGVQLRDPTGACRLQDCGERGGYNSTQFSFAQRTPASR